MNLNQKYEAATKAHEAAMVELERACKAYGEVEPSYADLRQKLASLQQSKREQQEVMASAKKQLAAAMLSTMGQVSVDAKKALAARRDADDLVDQFNELEEVVNGQLPAARIQVSLVAREYLSAYNNAAATWAEMNALGVLVDCGERLAEAMSVRMLGVQDPSGDGYMRCGSLVLEELRYLCEKHKEGPEPYAGLIPAPQLGALAGEEILSPATASMMKMELTAVG